MGKQIVTVQLLSRIQLFATPWTATCQASLSFTISGSLFKLISISSVMLSSQLILGHPLFLLPSVLPSIWVFSSESALCIRWPKYWSFSFSISPSNEYSGLIFFRIDWFDLNYNPIKNFFSIMWSVKSIHLVLLLGFEGKLESLHLPLSVIL